MPQIQFPTFRLHVPDDWEDITDTVDVNDPPITLARGDGVGALQFSIALYTDGKQPDPTPEQLLGMVAEFGESRGLGAPGVLATQTVPLRLAAASFKSDGDFLRVWYVSDGLSFALVTYVCESGKESKELATCEQIVRSIAFTTPAPSRHA
jgi:hypothetical protein